MSRCIREVDHFYIVYCNTVDIVYPFMFETTEVAKRFVAELHNDSKMLKYFDPIDNPIDKDNIQDYEQLANNEEN